MDGFNHGLICRTVVIAMVISLGGVVMIAQPSFLFGGQGINKLGLGLAIMQVCLFHLAALSTSSILHLLLLAWLAASRAVGVAWQQMVSKPCVFKCLYECPYAPPLLCPPSPLMPSGLCSTRRCSSPPEVFLSLSETLFLFPCLALCHVHFSRAYAYRNRH